MRRLLLPIALLYHLVLLVRHKLYDWHLLRSTRFDAPVVCVGNLSLGGTGKTPLTEYLIRLLSADYRIATLSRGYGRAKKGWRLADEHCAAADIGDEPMQYFSKFGNIQVAVDENRVEGVQRLLDLPTPPQVILLDDAFQHRKIEAGLNILITEFNHLFCDDYLVPAGHLRDIRRAARRADILVVSKAPKQLGEADRQSVIAALRPTEKQKVYFSYLEHEPLLPLNECATTHQPKSTDAVLLFTGIGNPKPLTEHLLTSFAKVEHLAFGDHHTYIGSDIKKIAASYATMEGNDKIVVTTEKDLARLAKSAYLCQLESVALYAAPVSIHFHEEEKFNEEIKYYVRQNPTNYSVSAPSHTGLQA